tara:strand:+ start:68 stop:286 length:219 start_codon:yes stop_codon:yes gene_type:complete
MGILVTARFSASLPMAKNAGLTLMNMGMTALLVANTKANMQMATLSFMDIFVVHNALAHPRCANWRLENGTD